MQLSDVTRAKGACDASLRGGWSPDATLRSVQCGKCSSNNTSLKPLFVCDRLSFQLLVFINSAYWCCTELQALAPSPQRALRGPQALAARASQQQSAHARRCTYSPSSH